MKKIIFSILLVVLLHADLMVDVRPKELNADNVLRFNAEVGSGFYGASEGSIKITIDRNGADLSKKKVYLKMDDWQSPDGLSLPNGNLQWKIYHKTNGVAISPSDWVAYSTYETPAFELDDSTGHIEIELGTMLRYVPPVQPNGEYRTRIEVLVD
ncbi:MAG: hypothetical protein LBK68_01375 [Candidatus Margulisbacteria bacterium]|jgi:hypothetical protein|nr:hypothetical protein [Candidatus Margulisiibacteriota bacterium]